MIHNLQSFRKITENETFGILQRKLPHIRKNGLRKTLFEAATWEGEDPSHYECDGSIKHYCIPDATGWRKQRLVDGREVAIVECYEIENTHKLTHRKVETYEVLWHKLDCAIETFFELIACDKFGGNMRKVADNYSDRSNPPVFV